MSHKVLLGCGMAAGLAFCTQVCAAEGKYDMTSCYSGPSHVIQQGEDNSIPAALTIGPAGGPFEREADAVADNVAERKGGIVTQSSASLSQRTVQRDLATPLPGHLVILTKLSDWVCPRGKSAHKLRNSPTRCVFGAS